MHPDAVGASDVCMLKFRGVQLASLIAAFTLACGPYHQGQAGGELATRLYFTNESLDQAAVYATSGGGSPIRIGTVMAGRTETLVVPTAYVDAGSTLYVFARPLGRNITPDTGPLVLHRGEALSVRMPMDQRMLI